jgi:hypothetical protein
MSISTYPRSVPIEPLVIARLYLHSVYENQNQLYEKVNKTDTYTLLLYFRISVAQPIHPTPFLLGVTPDHGVEEYLKAG